VARAAVRHPVRLGRALHPEFEESLEEIARALLHLVAVHLQILEVFDDCFAGAFRRDAEWIRRRQHIAETGQGLAGALLSDAFDAEAE
jgi:hypothetical protein